MPKYFITDLINGAVVSTNSDETASSCAASEEFFVVNTENGKWLLETGEYQDIKEI